MGPDWVEVRNAAAQQTLRAGDKETLGVVARFDQLLAFAGMELSRRLGVNVQQRLTRKERADHAERIQNQAARLAKTGQLNGSLMVPRTRGRSDRHRCRSQGESRRLHNHFACTVRGSNRYQNQFSFCGS